MYEVELSHRINLVKQEGWRIFLKKKNFYYYYCSVVVVVVADEGEYFEVKLPMDPCWFFSKKLYFYYFFKWMKKESTDFAFDVTQRKLGKLQSYVFLLLLICSSSWFLNLTIYSVWIWKKYYLFFFINKMALTFCVLNI